MKRKKKKRKDLVLDIILENTLLLSPGKGVEARAHTHVHVGKYAQDENSNRYNDPNRRAIKSVSA